MRRPKPKETQEPLFVKSASDKHAERCKQWRKENREKVKAYNAAYHEAHKEERHAANKEWRRNNKLGTARNNKRWNKKNLDKRLEFNADWRASNPRYRPNYMLVRNYKITLDEFEALEKKQNGVCIVCGKPQPQKGRVKRLHVDHDHACCSGNISCGKCIRGLTCANCNLVLGLVFDSTELLQKMIDYLRSDWRYSPDKIAADQL